ncbi:putative transcription factor GRF family [Helianthus annuus]|uniref:Transcription factor GRF family n=1 Tax=Helianthus annuus TaxID=4232 RepID=A0A9K3HGK0_HELAN|nr:putative transcription factor GRF family [Helianthus annuus]KAJ0832484.1 putative transcription factor GRF family [Helianthus annuus]
MKTQFQKRLGLQRLMKRCSCGRIATIRTSWTDDNPGRRFYSCLFKVKISNPVLISKCMF